MVIKETSKSKPDLYIIRDLKKDYNNPVFRFKEQFKTYRDFVKDRLNYYKDNKQYLDIEILVED